jgi:hypothetical protein
MKSQTNIFGLVFFIGLIVLLVSCQKSDQIQKVDQPFEKSSHGKTFYGSAVPMGNGVAQAWITEDADGIPTAVGVKLNEKALVNLPSETETFVLNFPKQGATDFYTHILVDWNPQGHEPPGTYDLPHFDFHFYIIPEEDRLMIGPAGAPEFDILPDPQYIPADHVKIPGGVPEMGAHWLDMNSPEFNGDVFTRTFIWGSWDGSFVFWEPMITVDFLESHPDETIPIPQPANYESDGWYASDYRVSYSTNPKEYNVSLVNLNFIQGQ